MWWRPTDSMNSIANLILHLCGNVRQWVISGVGGAPDQRNRPQEFAQRDRIPKSDLLQMMQDVAAEFASTVSGVSDDEWIRVRRVQGYDVSGVLAVVHSISHFRGHTQEIVHMTRLQLGNAYEFEFVPGPDQHGAGAG